ncbi:MAG: dimethylarginine dimethylaminohydrolase family protein [Actinomycetota bacterium]
MAIQNGYAPIRRVYVRPPVDDDARAWRDYGWRDAPDPALARDQHAAFRSLLADAGAEVVVGTARVQGDPDAIYTYDPVLMTDAGVILLRPGKRGRLAEPDAYAQDLAAAGVPVVGALSGTATAEGGDMFWLDGRTLLVGRGYRTNEEGVRQLRALLEPGGATIVVFDLPHFHGPAECLHLMSLISPLDVDLAVVRLPMVPVRLVELLHERGVGLIEVPDDEFDSMGPNVLALAPRVALAIDGNPETRRRMEATGVDVRVFEGSEISRKGDGGPTCLTRPLDRG